MILAGCVVCAVIVAAMWPREREPVYGGRKLSEWVSRNSLYYGPGRTGAEEHAKAEGAIRHIGTNALPWLVKWIRYEPASWERKLSITKLPAWLRFSRVMVWLVNDGAIHRKENAINCIKYLGADATPAIPILVGCLRDSNRTITDAAAGALGALAIEPYLALPALTNALEAPNARLRRTAARAIGLFGDRARSALPALLKAINDSDFQVREETANAIAQIAPDKGEVAIPELTKLMNDPEITAWADRAAVGLAKMGKLAMPIFLTALTNGAVHVRSRAAFHLQDLGTNALPAVPMLVETLADEDWIPAQAACWTLGALRAEPELVVPALAKLVEGPKAGCRMPALVALGRFGERAHAALPAVVRAFNDSDPEVREAATNAVRKIAPEVLERGGARTNGNFGHEK
jgi:HEAT repeat protein